VATTGVVVAVWASTGGTGFIPTARAPTAADERTIAASLSGRRPPLLADFSTSILISS
jgi:hypothetical protein